LDLFQGLYQNRRLPNHIHASSYKHILDGSPGAWPDYHNAALLRVANLKVQRDDYKAMEVVLQRTQAQQEDEDEGESMELHGDAQ